MRPSTNRVLTKPRDPLLTKLLARELIVDETLSQTRP